ncbi:MAG: DHH family phosphoesterase [Clostridia bacterium]|nr:DHH family phosphoesterase [Clostridia bacterium]
MAFAARRYDRQVFLFDLIIAVSFSIIIIMSGIKFRRYVNKVVKDAVRGIKGIDHTYLEKFSLPAVVIAKNGEVLWYNARFKRKLADGKDCAGELIDHYICGEDIETLLLKDGTDIVYENRCYTVLATEINYGYVLYYVDDTDNKQAAKLYNDTKPVVASVNLDNRDEFERDITDDNINQAMVQIESIIKKWVLSFDGVYVKSAVGRYKIILDEKHLKLAIESKFKLLEEIRAVKASDNMSVTTISMGVGRGGSTLKQCEQWSMQALDLALGRGGDQVAIKNNDDYEFFGGVAQGMEKLEKVQARVIARTLAEKIERSDNIYIMGHQSSDLDAVGAAVGMWSVISKTFPNNVNIVINKETTLASIFLNNFISNGYESIFIPPEKARQNVGEKTLLIIVDTHSPTFVDDPQLYSMCKNIVVIDHHRMMVKHIDNASIFFHDPFASSASEMVTELVQYLNSDALNKHEAEALLAGIMLDTKNFVLRTGVRTFEAAAYLKRKGADTVEVKRLFSDSLNTYKTKSRLVSEAEIYNNSAIACTDETMNEDKDIRVTAAQAADELLTIQDVQASYVLYKTFDNMCVSARSLGDMNVQLVMEKLGGGGHQTMAGANLGKITKEAAREKLIGAINEMMSEDTDAASAIKRRNI